MSGETSLIKALHLRWEKAWAEFNRIDDALPSDDDSPDRFGLRSRMKDGLNDNARETDALVRAILLQVPDDDEGLTILAFHVWSGFGSSATLEIEEIRDRRTALESIFDYLMSEGRASMDMGEQIRSGTMRAFDKRRARTGLLPAELGGDE
jgi:hypothetical protein